MVEHRNHLSEQERLKVTIVDILLFSSQMEYLTNITFSLNIWYFYDIYTKGVSFWYGKRPYLYRVPFSKTLHTNPTLYWKLFTVYLYIYVPKRIV